MALDRRLESFSAAGAGPFRLVLHRPVIFRRHRTLPYRAGLRAPLVAGGPDKAASLRFQRLTVPCAKARWRSAERPRSRPGIGPLGTRPASQPQGSRSNENKRRRRIPPHIDRRPSKSSNRLIRPKPVFFYPDNVKKATGKSRKPLLRRRMRLRTARATLAASIGGWPALSRPAPFSPCPPTRSWRRFTIACP